MISNGTVLRYLSWDYNNMTPKEANENHLKAPAPFGAFDTHVHANLPTMAIQKTQAEKKLR